MAWDFDLGTGGYQYCGVEWRTGGWPGLAHADRIRYRARAAQRTVIDFHMVQSDIGDDNHFGVLDTLGTAWKTYEHKLSDFRGRLRAREGKADASKAVSFRWHVQFDKNSPVASGKVTLDDILVTGDLAAMYVPPEPAVPKTGAPPVSLQRSAEAGQSGRIVLRGGYLEFRTDGFASVRWLSLGGKLLGRSRADSNGLVRWAPPGDASGLILVGIEGRREARAIILAP